MFFQMGDMKAILTRHIHQTRESAYLHVRGANPFIGKITDITHSKLVDLGTVLKTGTPHYIVQDVVTSAGLQDSTCTLFVDFWFFGVIIYMLLSPTSTISKDHSTVCT